MTPATQSLVVLMVLVSLPRWAIAEEVIGKILQVKGQEVTIEVSPTPLINVGNRYEVYVEIPGVGKAKVARGRITSVANGKVTGRIEEATSQVRTGQLLTIDADLSPTDSSSPAVKHESRFANWPSIQRDQPWLGITHSRESAGGKFRILVTGVLPDGPAGKAKIRVNDFILAVNDTKISYLKSYGQPLVETISRLKAGDIATIVVERNRKEHEVQVLLEAMPPDGGNERILAAAESGQPWAMLEIGRRLFAATMDNPEQQWPYLAKRFGDAEQGLNWVKQAVAAGSAEAAEQMSLWYQIGDKKNFEKYLHYCNRARELSKYEDPDDIYFDVTKGLADNYLGKHFLNLDGKFAPHDPQRGARLYQELADKGSATAAAELGDLYNKGLGVPKDRRKALNWYHVAAKAGHRSAQTDIGEAAYYGDGFEQSFETALPWFKLAAENGDAMAMYYLGEMYQHGQAVERNLDTARKWYQKSVDSSIIGSPLAARALGKLDEQKDR